MDEDEGLFSSIGAAIGAVASGMFASGLVAGLGVAATPVGFLVIAGTVTAGTIISKAVANVTFDTLFSEDFYLPLYAISPQEIFAGHIPALDVNFINPGDNIQGENGKEIQNSARVLAPQISRWYVAIRNLVLVGLMVVLLYIGIRIVISSTAGEKAKYKEHIKDWIIAVVLVVFMHYIMAFALTITQYITNMLNSNSETAAVPMSEEDVNTIEQQTDIDIQPDPEDGKYYYYTNLMGYARLMSQVDSEDGQFTWNEIGYTIVYLVLVIYTVMFLIIYLKRVVYMAFLTMMAPLVALTYPIDKISDGQAQAFNMWLKEYVYNLLLQPFHLLLYVMLVGSAMELAMNNMIYAIVALGFLIPAEKLLRRFFGFEKANTTESIVGGVVGGSMAMNAIRSMGNLGISGKGSRGENGGNGGSDDGNSGSPNSTRFARKADKGIESTDDLITGVLGDSSGGDQGGAQGGAQGGTQGGSNNNFPPGSNPLRMVWNSNLGVVNQPNDLQSGNNQNDNNLNGDSSNNRPLRDVWNSTPPARNQQRLRQLANGGVIVTQSPTSGNQLPPVQWNIPRPRMTAPRVAPYGQSAQRLENRMQSANKNIKKLTSPRSSNAKKTVISGAKTAGKYAGKFVGNVGSKMPRMITKAALGAALGTAGIAAGVASGDLSNIAAYGAAAAGVGATLGNGVSNVAGNTKKAIKSTAKDMRADYEKTRYTKDERRARENARADAKWQESKEVQDFYKEKFGEDGYEQAMKDALVFRQHGITDDEVIAKARSMKGLKDDDKVEKTSKERMLYARAATTVKTEDDLTAFGDRMQELGVKDDKIKEFKRNFRQMNDM